jgi:hypothetical protein
LFVCEKPKMASVKIEGVDEKLRSEMIEITLPNN